MARRKRRAYPRTIYGPYGASRIIAGPDEWIKGWTEAPEIEGDHRPRPAPVYDRRDVMRRLREAGIAFDGRAPTSELVKLLGG